MSELKFEWQLDGKRSDELGILEKSLNYLSQQLSTTLNDLHAANKKLELDIEHEKALEQAQLDFFSAVSHELKTPITIIKGQIEVMLLGAVKQVEVVLGYMLLKKYSINTKANTQFKTLRLAFGFRSEFDSPTVKAVDISSAAFHYT